jgi:bifunctional non-homologous end joining protein LigD
VDKINRSRHIRGVALPRVQPIIPTWRKEPFDDPEWLFEFKYDGFRGLCYIEQRRCRFVSRNGNVLSRFEALGDQVAAVLDIDEAVIDGEVIVADGTGRPQFYELLRVPRSASYVAFDILWLNGTDLRACRSTSVGGGCRAFCQRDRRSFPRCYPSRGGGANSSS